MIEWPPWAGDVPAWITALAVIGTAYQLMSERQWRRREVQSARSAQAWQLTAWVVNSGPAGGRRYGIVVSNHSISVFHDVEIDARLFGEAVPSVARFVVLPPGLYFVEWKPAVGRASGHWEFARPLEEYGAPVTPLTRTGDYAVTARRFSDNLSQRWQTDHHMRLRLVSPQSAPA